MRICHTYHDSNLTRCFKWLVIEVIGKTITNVKSNSFRIGGATNTISKGVPYEKVKEMGRWQSDAAKRYIRIPSINVAALV